MVVSFSEKKDSTQDTWFKLNLKNCLSWNLLMVLYYKYYIMVLHQSIVSSKCSHNLLLHYKLYNSILENIVVAWPMNMAAGGESYSISVSHFHFLFNYKHPSTNKRANTDTHTCCGKVELFRSDRQICLGWWTAHSQTECSIQWVTWSIPYT